jgi:ABC-type glycerol-3-phosphate transport system permease component
MEQAEERTCIQPLCLWLMKPYVEQLPRELQRVLAVILPLLHPALAATAILGFLRAWTEYEFALVLTRRETVRTIFLFLQAS